MLRLLVHRRLSLYPADLVFSGSRDPQRYFSVAHHLNFSRSQSRTTSLLAKRLNLQLPHRGRIVSFHSTPPRRDVFFVAFPAVKEFLLTLTRVTLLFLPFVWRYRLWKKYPRTSLTLLQIPVFALCIVFALALDQSPRTQRWRLLLMTSHEELEWARQRFAECMKNDGPLLLRSDDPRVEQVRRVTERLITAIDDHHTTGHIVSSAYANWPPPSRDSPPPSHADTPLYKPCAKAATVLMPFRPETSNPTKIFEQEDWKLYVVDLPRINAFALPTREIVVYTGLIDLLDDDTLLAAVLAHEVSHVTQRHAVENAGFLNLVTIAFDIARGISFALTISFPFVTDAAGSFLNILNDYVAAKAYSRKLEEEADSLGVEFMATAGYDPRAALGLWEIMAAVEEDAAASGQAVSISDRLTLLRTHPTSLQRQKNIESLLPKALKLYEKSPFRRNLAAQAQGPPPTATDVGEEKAVQHDT